MFQRVTSVLSLFIVALSSQEAMTQSLGKILDKTHDSRQSIAATYLTPRNIERYQLQFETHYVPQTVTRYRTVLRERLVPRMVTVPAPVSQTLYREERYSVSRPSPAGNRGSKSLFNSDPSRASTNGSLWKQTSQVRKPPIQFNQIHYRTEKRFVKVKTYELEAYQEVIYQPVTKVIHARDSRTVYTARRVQSRLSPQYLDPFSPAIIAGYSSFIQPVRQPAQ